MLSPRYALALASACALSLLAGCATSFNPVLTAPETTAGTIMGSVHGGQQAVSGSHVYVMQVATGGYGSASKSLITSGASGTDTVGSYVLTDSSGGFNVSDNTTCTAGTQLYLLAEQGNPGLTGSPAPNNTAIGLMASLGACPASGTLAATVPFVTVNEVSTVVAAYALAGFATDALHLSSSGTALATTGLNNAAAAVPNMMSVASGTAYTATAAPGSTGVVPQAEINTLANILATCINTSGPSAGGCPTLFANATADGTSTGTQPTETATAAINIANHPAQAPTALYNLQVPASPFAPSLAAAPNDFTLQIYYSGGGLSQSTQNAVDGSGNVWVSSQGNNSLNEFSPVGVPLSGTTGYTGGGLNNPYGVAIDTSGNAWVANLNGGNVSKFNSSGVSQAGSTGFTNSALTPYQLAIDTNGYVWITNYTNGTVSKMSSTGSVTLTSNDRYAFLYPAGIAIDASNNVWVVDEAGKVGVVLSNSSGTDSGSAILCNLPCRFIELGAGSSPLAWISEMFSPTSHKATISSASAPTNKNNNLATDYYGGGLNDSTINILDGAGNIWVTNLNNTVSEFNSSGVALTPSTGFTSTLSQTYGIAVDGSGNVWVTDNGTTTGTRLMEIVGASTPTVTPLVQAVINNNIAGMP